MPCCIRTFSQPPLAAVGLSSTHNSVCHTSYQLRHNGGALSLQTCSCWQAWHHGNPGFLVRHYNSLPSSAIRKLEIIMIDMVNVLYLISGLGSAVHMHMAVSDVTCHPEHWMWPRYVCHIKDGKLQNRLPCLVLWATSIRPSVVSHVTQGFACCHGVSDGSLMASHENGSIAMFAGKGAPGQWLWALSELLVHTEHCSNTKMSQELQSVRDEMANSESGSISRFAGKGASELNGSSQYEAQWSSRIVIGMLRKRVNESKET